MCHGRRSARDEVNCCANLCLRTPPSSSDAAAGTKNERAPSATRQAPGTGAISSFLGPCCARVVAVGFPPSTSLEALAQTRLGPLLKPSPGAPPQSPPQLYSAISHPWRAPPCHNPPHRPALPTPAAPPLQSPPPPLASQVSACATMAVVAATVGFPRMGSQRQLKMALER